MGGSKMDVRTKVAGSGVSRKQLIIYGLIAVAVIALPIYFQAAQNYFFVRIFALMGIYVILALGLNIVVGYAGLLDLGYIAFYAMGAYVGMLSGILLKPLMEGTWAAGFEYWVLLPVAALAAAGTGVVLGTPVLRLRGDYLAIVTLGFGEIVRIAINNNILGLTNGAKGLPSPGQLVPRPWGQQWVVENLSFGNFRFSTDLWWYYVIVVLCLLTIFVVRRLDGSRLGRAWVAMREDEVAAASVGVNIMTTKLWAFSMGALWGGVAGITYAYWVGFISPESFNFMESVLVVCMVVLGGMGSIPGAILGAVILAGMPEIVRWLAQSQWLSGVLTSEQANLASQYRYLVFGAAMVIMMAFRPQGILPSQRRAMELHPEDPKVLEEENQQLWEAEHKHGTDNDLL
ncbi:MAG: ABC transporter ATP-binding protein [Actinomycetota bacterium]|nr:ABC transporter ATP-binding protein [Actinomycetota bacterium]